MATSSTRQRRPSAEDVTRESNSTASLFLGGARKNWMSSSTQVKPTKPNKPTNPAATSPSFPRQDAPHAMPPPDHTSPPTVPDRPEATLISPVTPRATIQSSGLHEPVATMIAPKVPDPPQLAAAPALPSPVPSTESYPSPVVDQLWMVNSTTAPSPGASTSVRSENPITTAAATTTTTTTTTTTNTTAPGTLNGTASNPSIRSGTAQIPQPSPASTSQETAARVQPVSLLHGSQNRSADGSFPDAQTWALWKSRLNTLKITADNGQLSPYVEPRIGLLYEACNYEDVDYLLLHYLFCRQFAGITSPATEALDTPACRRGLILMSDLLQSNDDLPIVLVRKFCQFPGNPIEMEYEPWYSATVGRIANTLTLLATGFAENPIPVYKELSERRFPFLVSEMKTRFGIRSSNNGIAIINVDPLGLHSIASHSSTSARKSAGAGHLSTICEQSIASREYKYDSAPHEPVACHSFK
ncbi:Zinc finger MIZ-type [Penicillium angulare]|uniref:Zinc finger MIZ-type n=1 Tax=Penicillium angulare TaxID=116970 RepID=UPI0025409998|nr:Zinc finger MIZ-type [Penicillium angulare]KAJ5287698.1 Zinc finger MIZ-type [Penicillium angulare]